MINTREAYLLTKVCRIDKHPVSEYPNKVKNKYLLGLGSILCHVSKNDTTMKFLFDEWCISLYGTKINNAFTDNPDAAVQALSLTRIGWHFFRMKYELFFDSFYIASVYANSKSSRRKILNTLSYFLQEKVSGFFTKNALKDVKKLFFQNIPCDKISPILLSHREVNLSFEEKTMKKVLVVANVSAGKSTLINALVGYRLNRAKTTACTSRLSYLFNKPQSDGITALDVNGSLSYHCDIESTNSDKYLGAGLHFNSFLNKEKICLIDTPGVNNANDLSHGKITKEAIVEGDYDALLYVSNCQYFGTDDERRILKDIIKNSKKPIIYVLNQLDKFKSKEDSISKMLTDFRGDLIKLGAKQPVIIPVSAHAALFMKLGMAHLDEDEQVELDFYNKKFSKDFFDLPSYLNESSYSLLDKTGITLLELTISKTIRK